MRGEQRQMQEQAREKNKLAYESVVKRERREKEKVNNDLLYLSKQDKKFNPIDQQFDRAGNLKR